MKRVHTIITIIVYNMTQLFHPASHIVCFTNNELSRFCKCKCLYMYVWVELVDYTYICVYLYFKVTDNNSLLANKFPITALFLTLFTFLLYVQYNQYSWNCQNRHFEKCLKKITVYSVISSYISILSFFTMNDLSAKTLIRYRNYIK